MRAHFGHDASPVNLDGLLDGPELKGNLLVQHPGDDQPEHLVFAGSESLRSLPELFQVLLILFCPAVGFDGAGDCAEKVPVAERLLQEIDGSRLHGFNAVGNGSVAGDEDVGQIFLQVETIQTRHVEIEDEACRCCQFSALDELKSGSERPDIVACGAQQTLKGFPNRGIVINHVHHRFFPCHGRSSRSIGRVI